MWRNSFLLPLPSYLIHIIYVNIAIIGCISSRWRTSCGASLLLSSAIWYYTVLVLFMSREIMHLFVLFLSANDIAGLGGVIDSPTHLM